MDTAELWVPAGVILALAGLLFWVAFRPRSSRGYPK